MDYIYSTFEFTLIFLYIIRFSWKSTGDTNKHCVASHHWPIYQSIWRFTPTSSKNPGGKWLLEGKSNQISASSLSSPLTLQVLWSNQTRAWFLDRTLQSKVALFWAGRQRATDLPILTGSSRYTCRSWNGCELGRQANTASAEGIDFGLRVLLQPDTRDKSSWSRVAGFCFNPPQKKCIIYNIYSLCVGRQGCY